MSTITIQTSGKKFEALQKKLKLDNAKFKKLNKTEQRIAIAKDVIAQLKAEKFLAKSTYFGWGKAYDSYCDTSDAEEANLDLSECVSQVQCSVCGIGSLFVSAARKADALPLKKFLPDAGDRRFESKYLDKWFDSAQLDLVEAYYEQDPRLNAENDPFSSFHYSRSPIYRESNSTKRLTMIMENIVSNNGKFQPARGKHKED